MMRTSLPGLFAAGDIRRGSVALVAAVAGDGATAAVAAVRYLQMEGVIHPVAVVFASRCETANQIRGGLAERDVPASQRSRRFTLGGRSTRNPRP